MTNLIKRIYRIEKVHDKHIKRVSKKSRGRVSQSGVIRGLLDNDIESVAKLKTGDKNV